MSLVFEPGSKVGGHKAIRGLAGTQTARSPAGLRGTGPSPNPAPPGARPSILLEPGDPSPLRGPRALLPLPWGRNHAKRRRGQSCGGVSPAPANRPRGPQSAGSHLPPGLRSQPGGTPREDTAPTQPHTASHARRVPTPLCSSPGGQQARPKGRGTHAPATPAASAGLGDPPIRLTATRGVPAGIPTALLPWGRTEARRARSHRAGSARGDGLRGAAGLASPHWAPRGGRRASRFPGDRRPAHAPGRAGTRPRASGLSRARRSVTSPGPAARPRPLHCRTR